MSIRNGTSSNKHPGFSRSQQMEPTIDGIFRQKPLTSAKQVIFVRRLKRVDEIFNRIPGQGKTPF